jgi:NAD(P)-dependent dehydrogenase (short-subunit alcohol dehydrogenase family)
MALNNNPVWFITGCSTGFGRELAQSVLRRGWRAVVTARDAARVHDLTSGHEHQALALSLDVTRNDQIEAAVSQAEERFGAIDVLVNNAGYGYQSAIEEGTNAEIRNQRVWAGGHDPGRPARDAGATARAHCQHLVAGRFHRF